MSSAGGSNPAGATAPWPGQTRRRPYRRGVTDMDLQALLTDRLAAALEAVAGRPVDPAVRRSQHADLQSAAALALARELGRAPRDIASDVVARADLADVAGRSEERRGGKE